MQPLEIAPHHPVIALPDLRDKRDPESAADDGGFTADRCREWANFHGMRHHVVSREPGQKGFVVLPRRWVVERSFGWVNRFRRLARDYERLPETFAGLHFVVFVTLMLTHAVPYF